jgi:hypothetical protein
MNKLLLLAAGVGAGLILCLAAAPATAQYRYTDSKGAVKVQQYKVDIPSEYRDAAEWVGPTGVGKPELSAEAKATKAREDAYRRIGEAQAGLVRYGKKPEKGEKMQGRGTDPEGKPMSVMCIAGVTKTMTSPGVWKDGGPCASGHPQWSSH